MLIRATLKQWTKTPALDDGYTGGSERKKETSEKFKVLPQFLLHVCRKCDKNYERNPGPNMNIFMVLIPSPGARPATSQS